MKNAIHPNYHAVTVVRAPAGTLSRRAPPTRATCCTWKSVPIAIPFYTGKQKMMDTAGRVERFQRKYADFRKAAAALQPKRNRRRRASK
jgi:large subunit ribosomal protein L31